MDRISQLNELRNFVMEKQSDLDLILNELNWSKEELMKNFNKNLQKKESPIKENSNHEEILFPERLDWNNYTVIDNEILNQIFNKLNEERTLYSSSISLKHLESSRFHEEKTNNESSKIQFIIPQKFSDLQLNFTREQKLAIYEYVIKNTKKLPEPEFPISLQTKDDNEKKILSFAEILTLKRDLKRRRQKYRIAKNPLTLTEEFRNLIELNMQALIQYLEEKNLNENNKKDQNIDSLLKKRKREEKLEGHSSSIMKKSAKRSRERSRSRNINDSRKYDDDRKKKKKNKSPKRSKEGDHYKSKHSHSHHKEHKYHHKDKSRYRKRSRSRS